ncbi:FAD-binding oxidoreductase [Trinickia caryophylli]|nr:FAD-binding oxidoreductase [Trinickia caryophylli]PMS13613.1 FAD-binding oxidoreductase [Trinickia caryophylli]TRX15312.1 FAD-binding oxidoreductase [Trinickia caryophylli]WQE15661.1 FAD-binding oxidoreductase [Trinickia caryophylli]
MHARSYYEATVERPAFAPLRGRHDAEVCIVGGGLAGLCTALGLVERGWRDIVVLDAERVGFGASGRNGGFVFGGFSLDNAALARLLGERDARALYRLTTDAVALIRSRIARYEIACDAVFAGALLADWFGEPRMLEAQRRLMQRTFGVEWMPVAQAELQGRLKTQRYRGGLLEPNGFHFHPLKYVLGIARVLAQAGVRIHEHSPATSIEWQGAAVCVSTAQGSVTAPHVVMAGGGYLHRAYRHVERAVLPIATYVMTTEPLGARLKEAIDCEWAVYDTRFAFDYYRALHDTRVLWGGRISIFERPAATVKHLLARDMRRVYPQLADVKIDFAWGGLMSYARHKMPQIGRTPDGVWHATGFGGHGMAPTTAAGELLAAAIAGAQPIPPVLARFGLAPVHGLLGLAAAELTYLTRIGLDAARERLRAMR